VKNSKYFTIYRGIFVGQLEILVYYLSCQQRVCVGQCFWIYIVTGTGTYEKGPRYELFLNSYFSCGGLRFSP